MLTPTFTHHPSSTGSGGMLVYETDDPLTGGTGAVNQPKNAAYWNQTYTLTNASTDLERRVVQERIKAEDFVKEQARVKPKADLTDPAETGNTSSLVRGCIVSNASGTPGGIQYGGWRLTKPTSLGARSFLTWEDGK